jgi:hypothetical protein
MKNWKLVTVAATLLTGLVFTAACTVEEGDPDGGAGAAGTGGSDAAGTGGTDAAGAAGEAGAAGAAATPVSYAEFWTPEGEAESACTKCIATNCAAENTACGDVFGAGACAPFAACLTEQLAPETGDPVSIDCAYSSCATANATDAVNSIATCVQDKCQTECGVTPGFVCN